MVELSVEEYDRLYPWECIIYSFFNDINLIQPIHFFQKHNSEDIVIIRLDSLGHKTNQILNLRLLLVLLSVYLLYLLQQLALNVAIMLFLIRILFVSLALKLHKLLNKHRRPSQEFFPLHHQNRDGQVCRRCLCYSCCREC